MVIFKSVSWALILATIVPAGAFARESAPASPAAAASPSRNELAPGFLIQLRSARDSNLNGEFRVDIQGKVALPYDVTIEASRKTLNDFRAEITQAYRPYFTGTPSITATIKHRSYWIDVRGLVARPGNYLVKEGAPLDEVLSLSGGLTEDLAAGFARIEQGDKVAWVDLNAYFKQGDQSNIPKWRGADRIFFQKERPPESDLASSTGLSGRIHVLGEVRNPGEQTFERKADGYHYLIKSGGPTSMSDLGKVEVVRAEGDGTHKRISIGSIRDVSELREADLLIVHPDRPSGFERFLQNTALTASILSAVLLGIVASRSNR